MASEATGEGASQTSDGWVLNGACFCGKVTFEVEGPSIFSAYCHCTICQRLIGGPFGHFVGFPKDKVKITAGKHLLTPVASSETMKRYSCSSCFTRVYNEALSEDKGFFGVPATAMQRDSDGNIVGKEKIAATSHIFYPDRLVDVNDNLPKFKGFPGSELV